MIEAPTPTAAVLIIGNEILSGRTQDVNLRYIALKLAALGIRLGEVRVISDLEDDIVAAVNALRARYTYVFTTGGIGPTHDDITTESIAKAFGVAVVEDPDARALLESYYIASDFVASRLRMARVPLGAELINNAISAAPGFRIENVYVMAGVPEVMRAMMDALAGGLRQGLPIHIISVSGLVSESAIAEELTRIAASYPHLDIGSYPWIKKAEFGTALVVRGTDKLSVKAASDLLFALMIKHGGNPEIEITSPTE